MKREVVSRTIAGVLAGVILAGIWWFWDAVGPAIAVGIHAVTTVAVWCFNAFLRLSGWLLATAEVPRWWYITLSLTFAVLIWRKLRSWWVANGAPAEPTYIDFTQLEHYGLVWRWEWENGRVESLCAFCPQCDRRIRVDQTPVSYLDHVVLFCSNCRHIRFEKDCRYLHIERDVLLEIDHAVRTGRWKQFVSRP